MVWRNLLPYHRFYYFVFQAAQRQFASTVEPSYWSRPDRSRRDEPGLEAIQWSEVGYINGAPSTPDYLLVLLRELSLCPLALAQMTVPKRARKPDIFLVPVPKKGLENWSPRFEHKITLNSFSRGSPLHQKMDPSEGCFGYHKRHFLSKNAFSWKPKKLTKSIVRIGVWFWFRIPQICLNVRARWVAKIAARFHHSKFETNPPWLRCLFEDFLV